MTTEAGKRLLEDWQAEVRITKAEKRLMILAIEAEAVAAERARTAEGVRQMASGGNYADERTQITLTAVLALIEDDEHYPGCPRNEACACAGRTGVSAKPTEALDVERLARALRRMVGGGADAIEGTFDVGWLTYSGEATFDELAAAILAALREGRTP